MTNKIDENANQLTSEQINALAEHVENAELNAKAISKITNDFPHMTWKDAYDVQWHIRARKEARGNDIAGMKMGLTSYAKMAQMKVDSPCYGFLADYFRVANNGSIDCSKLIHPKIEAEVAFVINKPLKGPNITIDHVNQATEYIVPALEIIDSRYENFKFDLKSVVADNSSSSRFVVGDKHSMLKDHDLVTLGLVMEINGEVVESGAGAAVLGNPAASVAMLANMLSSRGQELCAGTFVMTGGITAAVAVKKGDVVTVKYRDLGEVSVSFV